MEFLKTDQGKIVAFVAGYYLISQLNINWFGNKYYFLPHFWEPGSSALFFGDVPSYKPPLGPLSDTSWIKPNPTIVSTTTPTASTPSGTPKFENIADNNHMIDILNGFLN